LGKWLLFYDADQIIKKEEIISPLRFIAELKPKKLYRFKRYSSSGGVE
jgi:hypothetical protein